MCSANEICLYDICTSSLAEWRLFCLVFYYAWKNVNNNIVRGASVGFKTNFSQFHILLERKVSEMLIEHPTLYTKSILGEVCTRRDCIALHFFSLIAIVEMQQSNFYKSGQIRDETRQTCNEQ